MQFLKPNSSLMQFLGKMADIMLVNILFVVCSLPVVTVGAAAAAACKVIQDMLLENDCGILKRFFQTFRRNFRQATISWLLFALAVGILIYDALLFFFFCEGSLATVLYILLGFLAFLVLGTATWLFPLMVRYENSLRNHIRNAFHLMIGKIHRTIPAVLLELSVLAVPFFLTPYFIKYLYLWIFLLFGLAFYGVGYLLKPTLLPGEPTQDTSPAP